MTDLTLNTTDAVAVQTAEVVATPIDKFLAGAKALHKAFTKITASEEALFDQRLEVQQLREAVTDALAGKGDFDAASKAFKQGNNKLDKLIDANTGSLDNAKAGVDAMRRALDDLADDLRAMEA